VSGLFESRICWVGLGLFAVLLASSHLSTSSGQAQRLERVAKSYSKNIALRVMRSNKDLDGPRLGGV
jgi:hypothetical protein